MSRNEKRSDEAVMVREADIEAWRLCIEDKHEPQPRLGEFNWPWVLSRSLDEIERLAAALAASRADTDELRAEVERYRRPCEACGYKPPTHDHARDCPRLPALTIKPSEPYADRLESALAAARVEVSQLRANIGAAVHLDNDAAINPKDCDARTAGYLNGWDDAIDEVRDRLRAALAEPLEWAIDDSSPFGPCGDPVPDPGQPSTCGPCGFDISEHSAEPLGSTPTCSQCHESEVHAVWCNAKHRPLGSTPEQPATEEKP